MLSWMGRKEDELQTVPWERCRIRECILRTAAAALGPHNSRRNKDRDLLPSFPSNLSTKAPARPLEELLIANELQS